MNLLDLGELYIGASGSVASDSASDVQDLTLCVKFSASQILKDSIANVTIGKVVLSDTAPAINKIFNWFTGEESTTLTAGKNVILEGKRLKLGSDENCGLFLAPTDEKGEVSDDETSWLSCTTDSASPGSAYRIVIKSNYVNGTNKRKEPTYTYSEVVTVA